LARCDWHKFRVIAIKRNCVRASVPSNNAVSGGKNDFSPAYFNIAFHVHAGADGGRRIKIHIGKPETGHGIKRRRKLTHAAGRHPTIG
jgi:hypothetical protein